MAHTAHPIKADLAADSHIISLSIKATPEVIWKVLTTRLSEWWNLHAYKNSEMRLDFRAGGCLAEVAPDGSEVLWYMISCIEPNKSLTLWGHMSPPWARPSLSMVLIQLVPESEGVTKFSLSEVIMGVQTPGLLKQLNDGWPSMFEDKFRALCEAGDR